MSENLSVPYTRHSLDNGLDVVLSRDPSAPIVGVNLWYGVGSRNEPAGRTGYAHLFEHMMFQGSANVPKARHIELVERAGGAVNASTWFDRTNYFETLPSHYLELALWLESDRMGWLLPALTEETLQNQQDVVENERKQRYDNQPYGDWDERLQALVFPEDHPYRHTVIGAMEDFSSATVEDARAFFETYYRPNNAVLTLCGDLEEERALELVDAYFGPIPAGDPIPPLPGRTDLPYRIGETRRDRVEAAVPLPRIFVAFRIPPFQDDAFPAAEILSAVLADGKASRLYDSLVRRREVAKDVGSFAFPLVTGASLLLLRVTGYPGQAPEALEEATFGEIEALGEVAQEEVERAVTLAETRLVRQLEPVGDRADLLSMFAQLFDDPGRLNRELDRLRSVTPEEVRDFAATYLGPDNRAVVSYEPAEES